MEIKENSKPILIKRIISDSFDIMSLFILFMLFMYIFMRLPIADKINEYIFKYQEIEKQVLVSINNNQTLASDLLNQNEEYKNLLFATSLNSFLLKAFAGLISEAILFVVIPLTNKDKNSLGRLLTGLLLFDESRMSLISNKQLILRFIFIFFVESIALYPWTGVYTFIFVGVLRLIVIMLNNKDKTLCDYFSGTMLIEKMSYRSFE